MNAFEHLNCKIHFAGGRLFYVGGYVRDLFLNRATKDIDLLVTGLTFEEVQTLLTEFFEVKFVGKSFGVFTFQHGGIHYDVALPRTETSTGDGHKDFKVQFDPNLPIEQDLKRRDFTFNAMAKDAYCGQLIDPFGGKRDLERKIVKQVTENSIKEDYLRALRAIQFAARFGFSIDKETFLSISKNWALLQTLSVERIRDEFVKLLMASEVLYGFNLLKFSGLLKEMLPELKDNDTNNFNFIF